MNEPRFLFQADRRYKPIADYGVIGNLRTVALVGLDGSIDWCCFPHVSEPSVFAAILDHQKGGRFSVVPSAPKQGDQHYIEDTNVLRTIIETDGGRLTITDLMPLRGDLRGQGQESEAPPEIYRILDWRGARGVEAQVEWSPRFDYARALTRIHPAEGGFLAESDAGDARLALGGFPAGTKADLGGDEHGPILRASFRMEDGHRIVLATRWDSEQTLVDMHQTENVLHETIDAWRSWLHKEEVDEREWAEPWGSLVLRSELALKLLVHADTGGLVAAPTTSLPEVIGGVRNWDYRYSWIRDAAMLAQSLIGIGHEAEMRAFLSWARRVSEDQRDGGKPVQVMYGLFGEKELPEVKLEHLEGYRNSRPVRVGNRATEQHQHDIYSDLMCASFELMSQDGGTVQPELLDFLGTVMNRVIHHWEEPDHGIWEMPDGPRHYVFSKIKLWEALSRAIHFAEEHGMAGDVESWRQIRRTLHREVLERGYDEDLGAFVMAYDKRVLDAANLQLAIVEILPPDDPRVQSTIDRTLEHLTENGLVYRYRADDSLPGDEGAFALCTFWMVDALVLSGRQEKAQEFFEGIARRANHLGLYSEQIDPRTGEFLGNFPQAFSHIGLINSVMYLAYSEGRELPLPALAGTPEHRRLIEKGL